MLVEQANPLENSKGIQNYLSAKPENDRQIHVAGTQKHEDENKIKRADVVDMSQTTYGNPERHQEKVADTFTGEEASAMDRYNEMAVISNTASEEDLKKMQEDGFSIEDTDSATIITVTDKIKAALAKAGVDISEYGDTLTKEQLEQITGSSTIANQIVSELAAHDLPVTEQNVSDMKTAYKAIEQLEPLDDGAIVYMLKQGWKPTIENIYRAKHSNLEEKGAGNQMTESDFAQIQNQVEQIIIDAGKKVTEEALEDCRFLLQNDIYLTSGNLAYYEELKTLAERMTSWKAEELFPSMCDAITEGLRPMNAMLMEGFSYKERAESCMQVVDAATDEDLAFLIEQNKDITIDQLKVARENRQHGQEGAVQQMISKHELQFITAKRQLEEIRLAMTFEASYALLKKGISIETKPLEELVEQLKGQEDAYYKALLEQNGIDSKQNLSIFKETYQVISELKLAPAYIIKPREVDTLHLLHQAGMAQKAIFEKANESYESLMTAPRKDMGDSIQKAFANIDDILKDLNLETTEANRRAVRILAYNQTELTPENIASVKAKDEEIQRAFSNLTPKVVMELIRKEINPLDMEIGKLNEAALQIRNELTEDDTSRFQKYLWKLEQNKEITEEERSSYIGIYRLIAQVEKTDGAAIASLMQQGVDITMRSLLTAIRSQKKGAMDYQVDESFSGVDSVIKSERIDEQIMAAYQKNCLSDVLEQITPKAAEQLFSSEYEEMTPEQVKEVIAQAMTENREENEELEKQYLKEQMTVYADILHTSEEIYHVLERANIPNTMQNILAMQQMLANRNQMFETLWNAKSATTEAMEKIEQMKELILERFGEAVQSPTEMADAQEALADLAEHVMDTMIIEDPSARALDIKTLRLMHTQFELCAKQAQDESYMIPMQTADGVTGVSLKIVRGRKEKGMVDILFHGRIMGKVAATFEAKEKGISGMLATDNEQTRQLLSEHLGMLADALSDNRPEAVDLRVAKIDGNAMENYVKNANQRSLKDASSEDENEDYEVQTTRLYHIAESFIKTIQEFL